MCSTLGFVVRYNADRLGLFTFALPATFYLCYFPALMLTEGIAWSVHLWVGSIMLAGIAGWLLSYLLLPPRSSEIISEGCAQTVPNSAAEIVPSRLRYRRRS